MGFWRFDQGKTCILKSDKFSLDDNYGEPMHLYHTDERYRQGTASDVMVLPGIEG